MCERRHKTGTRFNEGRLSSRVRPPCGTHLGRTSTAKRARDNELRQISSSPRLLCHPQVVLSATEKCHEGTPSLLAFQGSQRSVGML